MTNSGTMTGIVDLGGGNDMLDNRGGTINGAILGGAGDDLFILGTGAETVSGGSGFDTLDLSSYTSAITVDLANSALNKGTAVAHDVITEIEAVIGTIRADTMRGNASDNLFVGNKGRDNLSGADGNDTLEGGIATDILTGGLGADVFRFTTWQGGADQITDFTSGVDQIQLEGSKCGFGNTTGAVSASVFVTSTTNQALDSNDRFIFNTTDATLWYDRDGSGNKAAVMVADLQDGAVLTADDLWLI